MFYVFIYLCILVYVFCTYIILALLLGTILSVINLYSELFYILTNILILMFALALDSILPVLSSYYELFLALMHFHTLVLTCDNTCLDLY